MLGRLSWWSSQANGWKRCLKDYCTAYHGIINREKVTLPRCAGEDPTDEVPFVLSLCAAEKFIKSSSKKENFIWKMQHKQNCFFFLLSMRRLLDLVLSFLLFLYLKSWPDFLFLDLNTNFNRPDFPDHLSKLDPSQLYFSSSPVDAIAWMLHHYIKVMTKQSLSSLSFTNFFQLYFSSWDLIATYGHFFCQFALHLSHLLLPFHFSLSVVVSLKLQQVFFTCELLPESSTLSSSSLICPKYCCPLYPKVQC